MFVRQLTTPALKARQRLVASASPIPLTTAWVLVGVSAMVLLVPYAPVPGDLGWQLLIGQRLLQGERLYVDIAASEMHPPLHMWAVTGAQWLATALHVPGWTAAYATTTVAALAVIVTTYMLAFPSPALLAATALAAVGLSGGHFAGEEHLAVLGILPYLAAAARTASGGRQRWPVAVAVGLAAGLGTAMKPHFALIWLFVESYLALRNGWRSFLRAESVTVLCVWIAYIVLTAALTPEFFRIARWALDLYPAYYSVPYWVLVVSPPTIFLLLAGALVGAVRPTGIRAHLAALSLLAAAAAWLAAVAQGKMWMYHWIPAEAFAVVAVGAALAPRVARWLAVPGIVACVGLMAFREARLRNAMQAPLIAHDRMAAAVRAVAPQGPVLTLTDQLVVAFPLVNELGAEWSSPYPCFWMAKALARAPGGGYAYKPAADWSPVERSLFDGLWRGIEKRPPRVIILQLPQPGLDDMDFRAFFETDPRIRGLLTWYEVARRVGPYEVLRPRPSSSTQRPQRS